MTKLPNCPSSARKNLSSQRGPGKSMSATEHACLCDSCERQSQIYKLALTALKQVYENKLQELETKYKNIYLIEYDNLVKQMQVLQTDYMTIEETCNQLRQLTLAVATPLELSGRT